MDMEEHGPWDEDAWFEELYVREFENMFRLAVGYLSRRGEGTTDLTSYAEEAV